MPANGPSPYIVVLARISTAAAISSDTLFLKFAFGFMRRYLPNQANEGGGYARRKQPPLIAREVARLAVGLWACYFATLELGGVRAAVLILACMAAGFEGVGIKGLARRKAVLGSVALAALWDHFTGSIQGSGGFGTLVAYFVLIAAVAGARNPWTPETKSTLHNNNTSFVAACILGAVGAFNWITGLGAVVHTGSLNGSVGLEILAGMVGAAGMILGEGARPDAACAAGVFASIAGGYAIGLIRGHDLLSELGLGGLALAGKHNLHSLVQKHQRRMPRPAEHPLQVSFQQHRPYRKNL